MWSVWACEIKPRGCRRCISTAKSILVIRNPLSKWNMRRGRGQRSEVGSQTHDCAGYRLERTTCCEHITAVQGGGGAVKLLVMMLSKGNRGSGSRRSWNERL